MKEKLNKKLIHICLVIVIISAIIFGVGIIILKYEVEGQTNLPFDISLITVISSIEGKDVKDDTNKWNLNVNQVNDVYIYIDKNNDYNKTEIIDSIVIENVKTNQNLEKGEFNIYKPKEIEKKIFEKVKDGNIVYKGDTELNINGLKISNQGGIIVLRFSNDNVANYKSNEGEQVDHNKLLQLTNTNYNDIRNKVYFDLSIKLKSGKTFKANISIEIPIEGIIEKGTTSKEIKEDIVFKRVENN